MTSQMKRHNTHGHDKPGHDNHANAIRRACQLVADAESVPSLEAMAAAAGLSKHHFHRVFKKVMGLTPRDYAAEVRASRLRAALSQESTVTSALYEAGFSGPGRLQEESIPRLGMSPSLYRRGGEGVSIRFAVAETSLGSLLVAATPRGVCSLELGDDADGLVRGLQDRFPKAELLGGDPAFEGLVAKVCGYVEQPKGTLDLPLDIQGTAFQHKVWDALRQIPAGETRSYSEVAEALGRPTASRAVARACASNAVAVAIPCHRVIRTDGSTSGYRWGVERKRELLRRESSHSGN